MRAVGDRGLIIDDVAEEASDRGGVSSPRSRSNARDEVEA